MRILDRINLIFHSLMLRRVLKAYDKKVEQKFKMRPELGKPVDATISEKHLTLYKQLGLPCNDKWLRLYSNLTGIVDYTYLPENLFYTVIERVLNDCDREDGDMEDKNLLSRLVDKEYLPKTYVRFIRGIFYDEDYNVLSRNEVAEVLSTNNGPIVGKIASESLGGHGVKIFYYKKNQYSASDGTILSAQWIEDNFEMYILQEKLNQCDFAAKFNPSSVNTCRITTLRCPWNGEVVVAKGGMRFGVAGKEVDNMTSGGVSVGLSEIGELGPVAFSYNGMTQYDRHPSSGLEFKGHVHPYYLSMCKVIKKYAKLIPHFNVIAWDVIADADGRVKIIELNLVGQGTAVQQFAFGSLFGKYTEPLIKWVAQHKQYDKIHHFRSF